MITKSIKKISPSAMAKLVCPEAQLQYTRRPMYVRSYMHKEGLMMKAINNIRVSRLCCPGWFELVRAIHEPGVSDCCRPTWKTVPLFPCVAELGFPSGFITGSHPPGVTSDVQG